MSIRFLRTYIEISNICNLQCTFCPEVEREKKILAPGDFRKILREVLPHTEQVCLHLMGEPLAHPEFPAILRICEEEGATVHLTTNVTYLARYGFEKFLQSPALRQINFSIHSYKDNFPGQDIRSYLYDILTFSRLALTEKPELYINFRLWNLEGVRGARDENQEIIDHICEFFQVPLNEYVDVGFRKSKNIAGRIYFHFDSRFRWPTASDPLQGERGFCHALSQQIGIHADGTVVPCCLDKEAALPLGNVLRDGFAVVLDNERLRRMREGLKQHRLTEDLCQRCTFIKRFEKKTPPPQ
jgi:radical SAM protein with 4Fe4S-binding SPASM domain